MNFTRFDNYSIRTLSCRDLFRILSDLADRRLLGAIELSSIGDCFGFVDVSPDITAALITHVAKIAGSDKFPSISLKFTRERLALCICGINGNESEMAKLARIGHTAGFESHHCNGRLELFAEVKSSDVLSIYAIKFEWLRDVFEKYFKD